MAFGSGLDDPRGKRIKKSIFIVGLIWTLLLGTLLGWNYLNAGKGQQTIALQMAKSFCDQIIISRTWNAVHGRVYVPVTKDTQPNPYLEDPLRDTKINKHLTLTKVNPAFMTRQFSKIAEKQKGVVLHITSLKPIRPANQPTPQEERGLKSFEQGAQEIGKIVHLGSDDYFFFMAPLKTEKACLKCHAARATKSEISLAVSVFPFLGNPSIKVFWPNWEPLC
jgi:hypothetical protein